MTSAGAVSALVLYARFSFLEKFSCSSFEDVPKSYIELLCENYVRFIRIITNLVVTLGQYALTRCAFQDEDETSWAFKVSILISGKENEYFHPLNRTEFCPAMLGLLEVARSFPAYSLMTAATAALRGRDFIVRTSFT